MASLLAYPPLVPARMVRRYKRFLAQVEFPDGRREEVHCPNSGRMTGCWAPGRPVLLTRAANPARRLRHTLELVRMPRSWVCVNTLMANRVAREAVRHGLIPELSGFAFERAEASVGDSRFDLLLTQNSQSCHVEVKSVTLVQSGQARFPDAVTARGLKHVLELTALARSGRKAALLFLVMRNDARSFAPASDIDPGFAAAVAAAQRAGVLILARHVRIAPRGFSLGEALPVEI